MEKKEILGITDELVEKCVRCGSCRQVCPVFNVTHEEPSVARGKIFLANLINKGEAELNREAANFFNLCTTCLRCAEICPVMVDYERIIISARARAVEKFGLPPEKKAVVKLFSDKRMLGLLTKLASPITGLLTKASNSPQNRLLPLKLPKLGKVLLPKPAFKSFSERGELFPTAGIKKKGRAIFFTGCMFNNFYVETAENVVRVLNALGYDVLVPKEQVCCGAPAFFSGDIKTFKRLKEENVRVFNSVKGDFILTACATCGHVLKKEYAALKVPVMELIEVLYENLEEVGKWKLPEETTVTWHHPCHIVRGQKVPRHYPVDVLRVVQNLRYVELPEGDNCCGMGGSFKISHPNVSREIQLRKAKNVERTQAEVVLTECPGCVMNIAEGLERINSSKKSLHIADLLAKALI